jgi:hypothetical protein
VVHYFTAGFGREDQDAPEHACGLRKQDHQHLHAARSLL